MIRLSLIDKLGLSLISSVGVTVWSLVYMAKEVL